MTTDRDQSIERLLRRARSSDQNAPHACPDAETLAALTDDTLTAAARREIEAHVADCQRCQVLTAAMVRAETSAQASAGELAAAAPWWKGPTLKWLVPAAAAATAIALWVAIPDQRTPPPALEPTAETQIAAAPPPAAPDASERDALQAPADARADRPAQGGVANRNLGRTAPAAPSEESPVAGALQDAGAAARRERAADQAVAGGLPPESSVAGGLQPSGQGATSAAKPPAAAAPVASSAAAARAATGTQIVSPDPQIRWRIAPGPMVQHSTDGGVTWTLQQIGASAELTAGSSPAADVCWLVGRDGLVLRTTDGGRNWQQIAFPEVVDLSAVAASAALTAVVDLADGRRFRTTDGGRSWAPARE